jgi:CheY-like chemotaxis protein
VTSNPERRSVILVIADEEETRYGIKRLLVASGYQVDTAKNEAEADLYALPYRPDLILMSLSLNAVQALTVMRRIRQRAGLGEEVPVVGFCGASLEEGAETGLGFNVYVTWPDNFDQLRDLISRLLPGPPSPG